jgi:hypothetical protein
MSEPVRKSATPGAGATSRRVKRILLVGLKQVAIERLVPALRRGCFEVAPALTGPTAVAACRICRYDLLLVREPVAELELDQLVEGVRQSNNLSRRAFIQVLTDEKRVEELSARSGERFGVSQWGDFGDLLAVVSKRVLGVSPRVAERFMTEVNTHLAGGTLSRFYQVENLSESGMLIRTLDPLPVGERVVLSFSLPGTSHPVRVSGEVVRHTDPSEPEGFGLRFDEFAGLSFRRLRDYLDS